MHSPSLQELPPPPPGKKGWPWTEQSPPVNPATEDRSTYPKISIVTPSFNQAQFIEETIRSVLLQGYPNYEYLVIDGGSTDNTVSKIKKYEKWLTYWISEKDNGQAHAINKGFKMATGEIVAWLNSDDYYAKNALLKVGRSRKKDAGVIIAGNIIDFKDGNGQQTIVKQYNISFENIVKFWEGNQWWHQPGLFFPLNAVKKVGYLNENLHYGMDFDLLCRLAKICETTYVDSILAYFRLHGKSKTVSTRHMSMYESSSISRRYWPAIGLKQSDEHDRMVTTWFVKRVNYFAKRLRLSTAYDNLVLSLAVSRKFTIIAILKEFLRLLMGGRFTGRL